MNQLSKFFFVLYSFVPSALIAQRTPVITIDDLTYRNVDNLLSTGDMDGNMCIYYYLSGKSLFYVYDKSGTQQNTLALRSEKEHKILAIISSEDYFNIYYFDSKDNKKESLNLIRLNKKNPEKLFETSIPVFLDPKEKYIAHFSSNKALYIFSFNKKTRKFLVKSLDQNKIFNSMLIGDDIYDFDTKLKSTKFIGGDFQHTLYEGHFRKKAYQIDSLLVMTFDDGYTGKTEVLSVNTITGQSNYSTFKNESTSYGASSNSFLIDSLLVRLTLSKTLFKLSVYSVFDTSTSLKTISITPEDSFGINDGPVIQKKAGIFLEEKEKPIYETKAILSKLNKGTPSLSINKVGNGSIKMLIGSYQEQTTGAAGQTYSPGSTISTPYGTVTTSGTWHYTSGGYYGSGNGTSTYFESSMSYPEFEKISPLRKKMDVIEDFIEFQEAFGEKFGEKTVFTSGKKLGISYVDKKTKTIKVFILAN